MHDVVEQLVVALRARAYPALGLPGHRDEYAERAQVEEDVGQAAAVVEAVEVERDALLDRQRADLLGQQADARLHPRALTRGEREREEDVVAAREGLPGVGVARTRNPRRAVRCAGRPSACAGARGSRARRARSRARAGTPPAAARRWRGPHRRRDRSPGSSGEAQRAACVAQALLGLRAHDTTSTRPTRTSRSGLSSTPPSPTRSSATGRSAPMSTTVSCSVPSSE